MQEQPGKIAIITDDPGWHGRQLTGALAQRGLASQYLSLTDCAMQIGGVEQELILPGFDQAPLGVFVRGVPGGTLEQVIVRLDILHGLQQQGITVFNTPRSIERTVDKPLTSLLLHRAGLPTPPTWICESFEHATRILEEETRAGNRMVLKPLFGSQGIGVHLIDAKTGLFHDENFAGIYYLQRYIEREPPEYTDIRVFVIDGIARAAMRRRSRHWITNRAQGATCERINVDEQLSRFATDACRCLDIDYAGVDIMQDRDGHFYIIEVNSIPAWFGLQGVVDFNIASSLIDTFLSRIADSNNLKLCSN